MQSVTRCQCCHNSHIQYIHIYIYTWISFNAVVPPQLDAVVTAFKDVLTIVCVNPYTTRHLLFVFTFTQYIVETSPTPTLYFCKRSQNTVCDLDRLLYRSPHCFYASPRLRSIVRRPPRRCCDARPSVPPLHGRIYSTLNALVRL